MWYDKFVKYGSTEHLPKYCPIDRTELQLDDEEQLEIHLICDGGHGWKVTLTPDSSFYNLQLTMI